MRPNLATLIADFRLHGDQIAVVTHRGNRSFPCTWKNLAELSARFAGGLQERGIAPGDRLLIWGDNSAEWVAAFFGCVLRGVVAVPLDAAGSTEFARRVVAEVQPKLLVGSAQLLARLQLDSPLQSLDFDAFSSSLPDPDPVPLPGLSRETPLQIVFTSGTTAAPKGIVHTHGNVLASLDPLEAEIGKYLRYERFVHPLRFLHTLPLSHVFGQFMGLWVPPLIAAEVHYESRLQAPRLIRLLARDRISVLAAVPRVLDLLHAQVVAEDPELPQRVAAAGGQPIWKRWWRFRRLHAQLGFKFWAFVSGGAALPSGLESFWTTAGFALIQGYGMTETTALVTLNHPFKITRGSIGKPLAGREIQIGPDGELRVRGASISEQVWNHGRMERRDEGWLDTGDLVTRNEQGDLVFAGRKSDVIVTSAGLNIHPQDLEAPLRRQAGVGDALVVSYPSPAGPAPAAVLILQSPKDDQGNQEAARAVADANRELAPFQQILYWAVWPQPDFPRTSTGKTIRRQVQSWAAQTLGAGEASADSPSDPLIEVLHEVQPASRSREIGDGDRLAEDLHFDSLAMVELQSAVELRFGLELDDDLWRQTRTVADLRALLHRSPPPLATTAFVQEQRTGDEGLRSQDAPRQTRSKRAESKQEESEQAESGQAALARASLAPAALKPTASARHRTRSAAQFPRWPWWPVVRILRIGFLELIARPLVRLLLAPKVERPPALSEPSLLIANHVTTYDVPILLYALRSRDRDHVAVAMSGEMLSEWRRGRAHGHPFLGWLAPLASWLVRALFNVFPLPRGAGLRQSFEHAGQALDRGYHVLVFPEGRRSAGGELQEFEAGIGLLAQESYVPVQPIYLQGLGPLKLHQRSWFRSGTVSVLFGKPLMIEAGEEPAAFARRLHDSVAELALPEARQLI